MLYVFGDHNRYKPRPRIEIVFAGFVDDPHEVAFLSNWIIKDFVNLPSLQRPGVLAVVNTNCEMGRVAHFQLLKKPLDLGPLHSDTVSFVPMNFGFMHRTILEFDDT